MAHMNRASVWGRVLGSVFVGFFFGLLGWAMYQPSDAAFLMKAIYRNLGALFTFTDGDTAAALWSYIWTRTRPVGWLVFIAFWVTSSRILFLFFQWANRPQPKEGKQ